MKGDWLGRSVLRVPEWSRKRGQNWGQEEGEEDWGLYSKVSSLSFSSDLGFLGRGQAWCEGRDRIRTSLLCHKLCHGLEAETGPRSPCSLLVRKLRLKRW